MASEGSASLLAGQALEASTRAREVRAQGGDDAAIRSIERSLRQTLIWSLQAREARSRGESSGFDLRVRPGGDLVVSHAGHPLPIRESYLRCLLEDAGVELRPGQWILLDAGIVKLLVEEALGALNLEEADRHDVRSRLLAASLEVAAHVGGV